MATTTAQGQSPKQLERKAAAKEEIVNATSGAREIVDHAAFNARAVGKILLHPFDKDARADAIATAKEDKAQSGQKMAAIRQVGAQQADALRSSARMGTESPDAPASTDAHPEPETAPVPASTPSTDAHPETGAAPLPASTPSTDAHPETEAAPLPASTPSTDAHPETEAARVPGDHDRD